MCVKCTEYSLVVSKNEINYFKYNFIILILFLITCSALGLSFYALLKAQKLTDDLNNFRIVLNDNRMQTFSDNIYKVSEHQNWGDDDSYQLKNESPILEKITTDRFKRQVPTEEVEDVDESTTSETSTTPKIHPKEHHTIKKKAVEFDEEAETFTPKHIYRRKHKNRNDNQLEIIDEFSPQAGRLKSLTAIHYDGDTSKYVYGRHSNFNGNGHLRHPKKTFVDWKESEWAENTGTNNHFTHSDGSVTIKQPGLYFIYSQIYYLDEHDLNGYRVHKNSDILLQCTVTSHSSNKMLKGNTCYTAGVTYLDADDTITVTDIADNRYSLFEPGKSFFGLIKLGDVKIK